MVVKVGNDEFCTKCMDWREYDEEGKCKVCGKVIRKDLKDKSKDGYSDYKTETPSYDAEEDIGESEF